MIVAELLIGRTPIYFNHAGMVPLLGLLYVVFSWAVAPFLAPKYGAQFL